MGKNAVTGSTRTHFSVSELMSAAGPDPARAKPWVVSWPRTVGINPTPESFSEGFGESLFHHPMWGNLRMYRNHSLRCLARVEFQSTPGCSL